MVFWITNAPIITGIFPDVLVLMAKKNRFLIKREMVKQSETHMKHNLRFISK